MVFKFFRIFFVALFLFLGGIETGLAQGGGSFIYYPNRNACFDCDEINITKCGTYFEDLLNDFCNPIGESEYSDGGEMSPNDDSGYIDIIFPLPANFDYSFSIFTVKILCKGTTSWFLHEDNVTIKVMDKNCNGLSESSGFDGMSLYHKADVGDYKIIDDENFVTILNNQNVNSENVYNSSQFIGSDHVGNYHHNTNTPSIYVRLFVDGEDRVDISFVELAWGDAIPTYTISYNSNDATSGGHPSSQTKNHDENLTLSTNSGGLSKTGYTFAGWNTKSDGTGTNYSEAGIYSTNNSATLYARWTLNTYSVSYNANGATSGSVPSPQTKPHNKNLTLNTNSGGLSKTGHTFAGWNTKSDGTGTNYSEGGIYSTNNSVTLYARWTLNTYSVSYNANGATSGSIPSPQTKSHNENLTLSTNSGGLSKTGHTFAGWNTKSDGTGTNYSEGGTYSTNNSVTLYARWALNTYSVSYNANGATSGSVPSPQTKSHNENLTLSTNSGGLSKTGHTFAGWNTKSNGTGTNYSEGGIYSTNNSVTLYARWTLNTYSVSYNANGATSGSIPSPQTKSHNVNLTLSTNSGGLSKTGHTFAGWNTKSDGTGTNYSEGGIYSTNNSATLYARWTLNTYSVSYNANGATSGSIPSPQTKSHNVNLTLSTNSGGLSKTGHTFAGWNTKSDGTGTNYSEGGIYSDNSDTTLYVEWLSNDDTDNDNDGYTENEGDHNDNDPTIHPGATEICNGIDDNCDQIVDNVAPGRAVPASPIGATEDTTPTYTWNEVPCATQYKISVHDAQENEVRDSGEWQNASDICSDGICTITQASKLKSGKYEWWINTQNEYGKGGWSDNGIFFTVPDLNTYYLDSDGDGYGDKNISIDAPSQPDRYVTDHTDCNDSDSSINRGATESCNGVDDNCDQIDDNVTPAIASLISPSGTIDDTTPTYTWDEVPCAMQYKISIYDGKDNEVRENGEWQNATDICSEGTCTITQASTLNPGDYKWWIQAKCNDKNGKWSEEQPFKIPLPLEITSLMPAQCLPGKDEIKLRATVKNNSSSPILKGEVYFYVDGPNWEGPHWIGFDNINDLEPDEVREYSIYWAYPVGKPGDYTYKTQVFDDKIVLSDMSDELTLQLPCISVSASNYFPINQDMEWVTTERYYKNILSTVIEGNPAMQHAWDETNGPWETSDYTCFTNNSDGLSALGIGKGLSDFTPFSDPIKILNSEVYIGDSIDNSISDSETNLQVSSTVLSISETVTVPAGTFENCIKLEQIISTGNNNQSIGKNLIWLAPGVGKIKVETSIASSHLLFPISEELISYSKSDCDSSITPDTAVLSSPSGTVMKGQVTFVWDYVPCASDYELLVWDQNRQTKHDEIYQASEVCSDGICSIALDIDSTDEPLRWWIQTQNAVRNGPWSEVLSFTIAEQKPYFIDQDNDGYGDSATFIEALAQPEGYVSDNTDCNDSDPEINPGALEICNNKDDNCNSIVDEGCGVVCDDVPVKVEQISPLGDTENVTQTFTWKHDSCTSGYRLEIMNRVSQFIIFDQSFEIEDNNSKNPEVACTEGICTLVLETPLEQGNYRWWIMAWNENGNGLRSNTNDFSVVMEKKLPSKVTPISPTGITENTSPVFNWTKDINSTWYKFWIGDSDNEKIFARWYDQTNICSEDNCSVTPELNLQNGDYEWYVKSWNDDGWAWNDGMAFSVERDDIEVLSKDYFPLSIGMEWTGTVYRYKNIGYKVVNGVQTIKKAADWNENGHDIDPWNEAEYDCYTNDSEGLRVHGVGEGSDTFIAPSTPVKILNATTRVGDVINNTFPEIDPDLILQYSVLSISETVTVPAGTFNNCIKLMEEIINSLSEPSHEKKYVWLAPGVGKIKVESITGGDAGMFWESEDLISYNDSVENNCTDVPEWISLTAPSLNIENTTPTFTWREELCTYSYEFLLKEGNNVIHEQWFDPLSICSDGDCSISLNFELDTDDYEWFVRGSNDFGNGPWGEGMAFDIQASAYETDLVAQIVKPFNDIDSKGESSANTIYFDADATSGSPPYTYHWYFENAQDSSKKTPGYVTLDPVGESLVELTVTDSLGNTTKDSLVVKTYENSQNLMITKPSNGMTTVCDIFDLPDDQPTVNLKCTYRFVQGNLREYKVTYFLGACDASYYTTVYLETDNGIRFSIMGNDINHPIYKGNAGMGIRTYKTYDGIKSAQLFLPNGKTVSVVPVLEEDNNSVSVDGYWDIYSTEDGKSEEGPYYMHLQQTGNTITGIWLCGGTAGREISGSLNGSAISLSWDEGSKLNFTITGTVDGNLMDGIIPGRSTWRAVKGTEKFQCGSWDSYVGYWTGVLINKSGQTTDVAVSIQQNGEVEWRAISSHCTGGGKFPESTWGDSNYTAYNPINSTGQAGTTITINFANSSSATINVEASMDCYTFSGNITKMSSSPQELFN